MSDCQAALVPPDEGKELAPNVNVVGLSCTTQEAINDQASQDRQTNGLRAGIGIISVLLVMTILIIVRFVIYTLIIFVNQTNLFYLVCWYMSCF